MTDSHKPSTHQDSHHFEGTHHETKKEHEAHKLEDAHKLEEANKLKELNEKLNERVEENKKLDEMNRLESVASADLAESRGAIQISSNTLPEKSAALARIKRVLRDGGMDSQQQIRALVQIDSIIWGS